jgi:cytochrome b561
MTDADKAPFAYDRRTIILHWLTAVLVGLLWVLGQTIGFFPRGVPRIDARSVHITLGLLLGFVLLARLYWRNRAQGALKPERSGLMEHLAEIGHIVLYALLMLVVALGLANVLVRANNIFDLAEAPPLWPADRAVRQLVSAAHAYAANALAVAALLHSLVALFHHHILRDDVLARMLPLKRSNGRVPAE